MASAAQQRTAALKAHFAQGGGGQLRPIATSLNADSAWLLSYPQPATERAATGRSYYHIVVDPWLQGIVSEVTEYFVRIELNYPQAFTSTAEIDNFIAEIEDAAAAALGGGGGGGGVSGLAARSETSRRPTVDALIATSAKAEHCHEPGFRLFPAETLVLAPADASKRIRGWNHFTTVLPLQSPKPAALGSWRDVHPGAPLPGWLNVFHLSSTATNYFGVALVASYDSAEDGAGAAAAAVHELTLLFPHGLSDTDRGPVEALLHRASPPLTPLAVLHPLNDYIVFFGKAVQSGANAGLRLMRESAAKYWLKTADADFTLTGLAGWIGKEIHITVQEAMENEAKKAGEEKVIAEKPNFFNLENGACVVLA